jgi:hypothetical protein
MDNLYDNEKYYYRKYLKYKIKYLLKKQSGAGFFDSVKNKASQIGQSVKQGAQKVGKGILDSLLKPMFEKFKKQLGKITLEDFISFIKMLLKIYTKLIRNGQIKQLKLKEMQIGNHKKNILDSITKISEGTTQEMHDEHIKELFTNMKKMVNEKEFTENKELENNPIYNKLAKFIKGTDPFKKLLIIEKQSDEQKQSDDKELLVLCVYAVLMKTLAETIMNIIKTKDMNDINTLQQIILPIFQGLVGTMIASAEESEIRELDTREIDAPKPKPKLKAKKIETEEPEQPKPKADKTETEELEIEPKPKLRTRKTETEEPQELPSEQNHEDEIKELVSSAINEQLLGEIKKMVEIEFHKNLGRIVKNQVREQIRNHS